MSLYSLNIPSYNFLSASLTIFYLSGFSSKSNHPNCCFECFSLVMCRVTFFSYSKLMSLRQIRFHVCFSTFIFFQFHVTSFKLSEDSSCLLHECLFPHFLILLYFFFIRRSQEKERRRSQESGVEIFFSPTYVLQYANVKFNLLYYMYVQFMYLIKSQCIVCFFEWMWLTTNQN